MKLTPFLLIPLLFLSSCTIDWNDEKDKKIAELEKQVQELKNEVNIKPETEYRFRQISETDMPVKMNWATKYEILEKKVKESKLDPLSMKYIDAFERTGFGNDWLWNQYRISFSNGESDYYYLQTYVNGDVKAELILDKNIIRDSD
jgi:hypothetical protein